MGPGAIQAELNAHAAPDALVFGADTSTSDVATLGGMVGNNSAGMRSLVYGTTADQVVGLRCVLAGGETVELRPLPRAEASGAPAARTPRPGCCAARLELGERYGDEIRRRYPKIVRRVSGYGLDALVDPDVLDLTRLVCGSEGTLAVVTRVDLRLHPLPAQRRVATLEFASLAAAAAATPALLDTGPSYVELLDRVALERARANPAYRDATAFVSGDPAAVLLVEYSGEADVVGERMDALAEVGRAVGAERSAELPGAGRGPHGGAAQGDPAAAPGHDRGAEAGRVRRGRRRAARAAGGVRGPLRGAASSASTRGRASTATPRWAACTCARR